jgi:multiple sugar transport system substrate-binding protein
MKKVFVFMLALVLAFGLTTVSAYALDVNTEISGDITFLTWGEPSRGTSMTRIAEKFMEYYPNVKVTIDCAGDNFTTKFMTLAAAGTPADVVLVNELYGTGYYCNGMYENLTPFIENDPEFAASVMDKVPDDVKNVFYWQGECFALPTMNYVFSLYYNKDMFDAAGIAYPDETWTWDTVREAANAMTIKDEQGVTSQYGIYFTREIVYEFSWFFNNGSYIISNDRTTCDLNTPGAIEAWQWMQDLIHKDGCAPVPDTTAGGSQLAAMSFDTGKVAMQLFGSWMLPTYETLPFNWGAAPLPSKDGTTPGFSSSCPNGFGIGKGTKYPEAAWAFAKFCTSEEGQLIIAEEGLAQPTLEAVMYSEEFQKGSTVADMNQIRESLLTCKGPNAVPRWDEILQNYISIAVDNILIYGNDVASEAEICAEGVNGILNEIQQGIYN